MSCKSLIYTALTAPTAVLAGGTIPLGALIRRYGYALALSGDGIFTTDAGYYDISASITVEATAAGPITASVLADGVKIPGATATATAAAAGDAVNLSIASVLRNCGCSCPKTLTVQLSAAGTVTNMALVVEKV